MSDSYNIRQLEPQELYELLPYTVRGLDPNQALFSYMAALAGQHNFVAEKLNQLPTLQDPVQAASWTIAETGESEADWQAYQELVANRQEQTEYGQFLAGKIPQSLAKSQLETQILNLLGTAVGNQFYARYLAATNRKLIQSAVYRHHVKGTHASVYIVGRILGFLELKVQELWTRFSLTDPASPGAFKNDQDFAPTPEDYPHWPLNDVYGDSSQSLAALYARYNGFPTNQVHSDALESRQLPLGTPGYNPFVIDDGQPYTETFGGVSGAPGNPSWYVQLINGHNPLGSFTPAALGDLADARLVPGIYYCSGGSFLKIAGVSIPDANHTEENPSYARFDCLTWGDWGNQVVVTVSADINGSRRITLSGPRSKIKFKSSYFNLTTGVDNSIFSSLFAPVPVTTNGWGTADDPELGTPQTLHITAADNEAPNQYNVTLQEDTLLPLYTVGQVAGVTGLTGPRRIREIVSNPAFNSFTEPDQDNVLQLHQIPGGPVTLVDTTYPGPSYPTFTVGRLAGDYPVTGTADGGRIIASPETHFQINYQIYFEIIATLRDLFERIRPITRTQREDNFGFTIQDSVPFAPYCAINKVVLASPNSQHWLLDVINGAAVWVPTADATTGEVLQQERATGIIYRWTVTNDGAFLAEQETEPDAPVSLVFLPSSLDGSFRGHVFLRYLQLQVSNTSPEENVDSIHIDPDDPDETEMLEDKQNLVERPGAAIAQYLSPDADSEDLPRPCFTFQSRPEDTLTMRLEYHEALASFRSDQWVERDLAPSLDVAWEYDQNNIFTGRDLRQRFTGFESTVIEPVPSGYLDADYPVQFIDGHGKWYWRDRITNVMMVSEYLAECDNEDDGPTRVDTPVDGDGRQEPDPNLSSTGFGVTPNNQSGSPEIEPWVKQVFRDGLDYVAGFTAVSAASGGGGNRRRFTLTTASTITLPGTRFTIDSGAYAGTYKVANTDAGAIDAVAPSAGTASGDIWWHAAEMQCWPEAGQGKTFTLMLDVLGGGISIQYRLALVDPDGTVASRTAPATVLLGSSISVPVDATAVPNYGKLRVEVQGTARIMISLTRPSTGTPVFEGSGEPLWGGGTRHAVGLTFLANEAQHFWTMAEGGVSPYDAIPRAGTSSVPWRGGIWPGPPGGTYEEREGLPAVLTQQAIPLSPPENVLATDTGLGGLLVTWDPPEDEVVPFGYLVEVINTLDDNLFASTTTSGEFYEPTIVPTGTYVARVTNISDNPAQYTSSAPVTSAPAPVA